MHWLMANGSPRAGCAETAIDALGTAEAEAGLARRWVSRFGPATADDLQWWAGWTKTATRRALEAVGAEPVRLDCGDGVTLPGDADGPESDEDPGPWVALLPGLDPTAMGWKQKAARRRDRASPGDRGAGPIPGAVPLPQPEGSSAVTGVPARGSVDHGGLGGSFKPYDR